MAKRDRMSGNEAVATAMKQINPDVMGAFPITPSTEIPQYFSQYIADGRGRHRVRGGRVGAQCDVGLHRRIGSRRKSCDRNVIGGTGVSCGSCFTWQRRRDLPITMAVVNRALTGPININNDHSDSMGARDSGWIQIYAESNQEVYDNYIQAMPISETIRLPIMICQDGFITSHGVSNIELLEDEEVKEFVGEYKPENYLLKSENPLAVGPYGISPYYMEVKRSAGAGHERRDADNHGRCEDDIKKLTGREYGFFEEYMMDDAEVALVVIGSSAGNGQRGSRQTPCRR